MRKTFTPRYDNDYVQKWYLTEALKDVPFAYELITDRGWKVKKYNDGTFEAWYPYTSTNTTTATTTMSGMYVTSTITILAPKIAKRVYDYRVNASFTTTYSWAIYWMVSGTTNLRYVIAVNTSISTETTYRQSAYMFGTWK